jgi:hypothetical protein
VRVNEGVRMGKCVLVWECMCVKKVGVCELE